MWDRTERIGAPGGADPRVFFDTIVAPNALDELVAALEHEKPMVPRTEAGRHEAVHAALWLLQLVRVVDGLPDPREEAARAGDDAAVTLLVLEALDGIEDKSLVSLSSRAVFGNEAVVRLLTQTARACVTAEDAAEAFVALRDLRAHDEEVLAQNSAVLDLVLADQTDLAIPPEGGGGWKPLLSGHWAEWELTGARDPDEIATLVANLADEMHRLGAYPGSLHLGGFADLFSVHDHVRRAGFTLAPRLPMPLQGPYGPVTLLPVRGRGERPELEASDASDASSGGGGRPEIALAVSGDAPTLPGDVDEGLPSHGWQVHACVAVEGLALYVTGLESNGSVWARLGTEGIPPRVRRRLADALGVSPDDAGDRYVYGFLDWAARMTARIRRLALRTGPGRRHDTVAHAAERDAATALRLDALLDAAGRKAWCDVVLELRRSLWAGDARGLDTTLAGLLDREDPPCRRRRSLVAGDAGA